MAILDSKGRLFGKISILDIGAALVILLVIVGVLLPSTTGAQQGEMKPVEVDVIVKGFSVSGPPQAPLKEGDKASIVIRNQPSGDLKVISVKELPRTVIAPQPDGSVKYLPDPRPEQALSRDYLVTVGANARITKDGPVLGNSKMKTGVLVELEGFNYDFPNLPVQDVRIK
jgi:hypothetical protein